jgi:uncharacterized repeat protein (TIGR01451 family)
MALHSAPVLAQSLTKTGRDLTTQSTTDTQAGRTVRYAVTLGLPAGQSAAALTISDSIPAGMEYVAGSLQLPPNAVGSWSVDGGANYTFSEPSTPASVTNVRVAGASIMMATSAIGSLPIPPAVSSSTATSTGGDGYRAIPYNGKIYNIFHHWTANSLYCSYQATGAACPGFPTNVPETAGQSFVPNDGWYYTSLVIGEYLDRASGRMYFWARTTSTNKPVVICADLNTGTSCGSYTFTGVSSVPAGFYTITGANYGTRFYGNGANGRLMCIETSTMTPCAGTDAAGTFAVAGAPSDSSYSQNNGLNQIGTRLYWQAISSATSQSTLLCYDMATNAVCSGSTPITSTRSGNFLPTADAAGVTNGFCLARTANGTTCYDLNVADVTATQSAFVTYANAHPMPGATWGYGTLGTGTLADGPAVANSRTFWQDNSSKICWDWVTNAPCAGYNTSLGFVGGFYEAVIDPAVPNCVWSLSDYGGLSATSSIDGGACKVQVKTAIQANPSGSFCDGQTHSWSWNQINVIGVSASDYGAALVTIRDTNGNIVGDWNAKASTLPVDISSLPVSGTTASLNVTVELTGITNTAPFSATPSPYVAVTWSGDAQQVCFDAKLSCGSPPASPLTNLVTGTIAGQSVSASHAFTNVASACWVPASPVLNTPMAVPALDYKALGTLILLLLMGGGMALGRKRHR